MKLIAVALRDILTDQYSQPIYAPNKQAAIRNLGIQVNSGNAEDLISMHPEQFEAYLIAEYDTDTGQMTPVDKERISHLGSLRRPQSAEKQHLEALRLEAIDLNQKLAQANANAARWNAEHNRLTTELNATQQENTNIAEELNRTREHLAALHPNT